MTFKIRREDTEPSPGTLVGDAGNQMGDHGRRRLANANHDVNAKFADDPVGQFIEPCPKQRPVVRLVDDGGNPRTTTATLLSNVQVSGRPTFGPMDGRPDALPMGFFDASDDRRNFKVQISDPCADADSLEIDADIETLRPDRRPFSPPRKLRVSLRKVPGTNDLYRSRYLRLVVDNADHSVNPGQTVLTDIDPTDQDIEILGQVVRATYVGKGGKATAEGIVGSHNKAFFRLAVHVVRTAINGRPVCATDDVTQHIKTTMRRMYAQVNLSPMLLFCREVDPAHNLLAISDPRAMPARGTDEAGAQSVIWFRIHSSRPGASDVVQEVGPYPQKNGDTPSQTAKALADLIVTKPTIGPGYTFVPFVVQNPAMSDLIDHPDAGFSADLVVVDSDGGHVTIELLKSSDPDQRATTPRMDVNRIDLGVPIDEAVGSTDMRTLMHAYDSGMDHIDVFVIGGFEDPPNTHILGKTVGPNDNRPLGNQAQPYATRSVFMVASELAIGRRTPSHECAHALLSARHALEPFQLMVARGAQNAVRFSELPVSFDYPKGTFVQELRMREHGAITMVPFP